MFTVSAWAWLMMGASGSDVKENGYCIVSKDSDYYDLSALHRHLPKVIWLRVENCSTETIFECPRTYRATIEEFGADTTESVLLLP